MRPDLFGILTWGYETSGDLDEATRVYFETAQREGLEIEPLTEEDEQSLKKIFKTEFHSEGL